MGEAVHTPKPDPIPSIGRQVTYCEQSSADGHRDVTATITGIDGDPADGCVHLLVMPPHQPPYPASTVLYAGEPGLVAGWRWPERV